MVNQEKGVRPQPKFWLIANIRLYLTVVLKRRNRPKARKNRGNAAVERMRSARLPCAHLP
jgi:hypothetical protein